jgi:hypothetical protein
MPRFARSLRGSATTLALGKFAGLTLYLTKHGLKPVLLWHMLAVGACHFEPNDDVDQLEWPAPEGASRRLDHPAARRLLRNARLLPAAWCRSRSSVAA